MTFKVAFGRSCAYCSPQTTGTIWSSRPHTTIVGLDTRGRKWGSRGLCMYGFQVSRADISRARSARSCCSGVGGVPYSSSHSTT